MTGKTTEFTTESNASTTSFQSTTTVSSTSPLSARPAAPQKDYAAALSALQSRYGTGGGAFPSPKAEPSKKLPDSPLASPSNSPSTSMGGVTPNDSQATLAESSTGSEGSGSATASTSTSGGSSTSGNQSRKKSKTKSSILKSLFKGKSKET